MKKVIILMIILSLILGLCACGAGAQQSGGSAAQNKPVAGGKTQDTVSGEAAQTPDPTEELSIWETEFPEEECKTRTYVAPTGEKITSFNMPGEDPNIWPEVRRITEYPNGTVEDSYYYTSSFGVSKSITTTPDGSCTEYHYLDNGYREGDIWYQGTLIYTEITGSDGYYREIRNNENGIPVSDIMRYPDGSYSESYHYDTYKIEIHGNTNTDEYNETEYFENGNVKRAVCKIPADGTYWEQDFFENGNIKYSKNLMTDSVYEERYDEEGYRTYFHFKDANWEIECISDETGKLIKVIQNGEVKEDEETLAQCASSYNFRK